MDIRNPSDGELFNFITLATKNTYAGGGKFEKTPQRPGHSELRFIDDLMFPGYEYRDSYAGFVRSRGSEYVLYNSRVIWENGYGGGMVEGKEDLADECFGFLKKAMRKKDSKFKSFRGPKNLMDGYWSYKYDQTGDIKNFLGHEEISYKGELVFWHDIAGGVVQE